jgi:hypothetical protein
MLKCWKAGKLESLDGGDAGMGGAVESRIPDRNVAIS